MADEERKEAVEVTDENKQEGLTPRCKSALIAFILTAVAAGFAFASFAGIIGIVLPWISRYFWKQVDGEPEKQPFKVFHKISKIANPIIFLVACLSVGIWLILTIIGAVAAAAAA